MSTRIHRKRPGSARRFAIHAPSRAESTMVRTIADGVEAYDRRRHLPRVLPLGPAELADESASARRAILIRLARAIRAERTRGRAGHWTYDLNRHIALHQAYAAESRALGAMMRRRGHEMRAPPPVAAGDGA